MYFDSDAEIEMGIEALSLLDPDYNRSPKGILKKAESTSSEGSSSKTDANKAVQFKEKAEVQVVPPRREVFIPVKLPTCVNVLLAGTKESGKTTMRKMVFEGYTQLQLHRENSADGIYRYKYMQDYQFEIRDGNDYKYSNENLYKDLHFFVFVFKVEDSPQYMSHFAKTLELVRRFSPNSHFFVLVNKMENRRETQDPFPQLYQKAREIVAKHNIGFFRMTACNYGDYSILREWAPVFDRAVHNRAEIVKQLCACVVVLRPQMVLLLEKTTGYILGKVSCWKAAEHDKRWPTIQDMLERYRTGEAHDQSSSVMNFFDTHYAPYFHQFNGIKVFIQRCTIHTQLVSVFFMKPKMDDMQVLQAGSKLAEFFKDLDTPLPPYVRPGYKVAQKKENK